MIGFAEVWYNLLYGSSKNAPTVGQQKLDEINENDAGKLKLSEKAETGDKQKR